MNKLRLSIENLSKQFVLHLRDQQVLSVLERLNLRLEAGQCMVLDGASGTGKSTLLKLIYGNYQASGGRIVLTLPESTPLELTGASPRQLLQARQTAMGYVSQFLRVIPRTSALEVVAEPLMAAQPREKALEQARHWLERLQLPERLWSLPPATFSGGEQQRVNIARCLIHPRPVLLLDEPTASLDRTNAEIVAALIEEARLRGSAILGIFHDRIVRDRVATHHLDMNQFRGTS